jgi:ankyrin repeat protein
MDEQLISAIEAKDLQRVEALLAAGANPNASKKNKTAYQLVPHGANEIKCALIEAGAEDPELRHALVWVISTGRVHAVRILIEQGADVNVSTYSGSPIQVAARSGHSEIVELLIAAGADVDAGSSISTPLLNAIECEHIEIALKLIAAGADPNRTADFGGNQPIALAAAKGSGELIQALIAAGADVNAKISHITLNQSAVRQQAVSGLTDAFGAMESFGQIMTSLENLAPDDEVPQDRMLEIQQQISQMESVSTKQTTRSIEPENTVDTFPAIVAARCGHAAALAPLLEAGADPHCKDGEGLSAYDWAVRNEYPDVLAVLRQFGITETRVSLAEKLLQAAEAGDINTVRECLSQGANVNVRDARRRTRAKSPLMLAARAGHLTVVETLLAANADPNLIDRQDDEAPVSKSLLAHTDPDTILSMGSCLGRTALMSAAATGETEIIHALIQAGANPNRQDDIEYTALALAVENNHFNAVRSLVTAGTDVNIAATYGNTPLILAGEKGAFEIAEFLLDRGANIATTNRDRETVLMKAAATGSLPLVRLCIVRGADVNAISKGRSTALAIAAGASHNVRVDKNDRSSGSSIREYRDDGSCWEWQPLPEARVIDIVRALLQAGANPNMPNCETTAAIEAARNGRLQLLQILLEGGALLDVRGRDGDTTASMAKLYGRQEIRQFLQAYTGTDLSEFDSQEEDDNDAEDEEEYPRWGEDLHQPDFSAAVSNPDYQQAITDLAELCGSKPTSNDDAPGWFSIHVDSKCRKNINTEAIQQQFLERGYFVYEPRHFYGDGPEQLCILPTSDKYDVIALHQTNGCNYGIGPGYVVQWLKELEAEQPFILTCIAHDTLAGRFLTPIADPEGVAERMYDFCSDIVDQGCGEVEVLAEKLADSDGLFFWWD